MHFRGALRGVLSLALCFSSQLCHGQVLYGSIVGVAVDASGAAVPNAAVTVTNKGTGQTFKGVTDDAGRYTIPDLQPGSYDVKVQAPGFRVYSRTGINVTANT